MGNYYFGNLPEGDYQVQVYPADEAQVSSTGAGADDGTDLDDNGDQANAGDPAISGVITLEAGTEPTEDAANPGAGQDDGAEDNGDMTIDFGFVPMMELGSTVFYDLDNDGVQDPNNPLESGIAGVTVTLYAADGVTVIDMTMTDADGNYLFDSLPPGDYVVGVMPSDDAGLSSDGESGVDDDMDGVDDGIQAGGDGTEVLSPVVTLSPGDEPDDEPGQGGTQDDDNEANGNMTVDFGFVPDMSIGSTVFYDTDLSLIHI